MPRARRPGGTWHAEFEKAIGDDLGTPAAVAAIHNLVREGNKLLAVGASEWLRAAARGRTGDALGAGLDPLNEHWDPARQHGRSGYARR